MKLFSVRTVFSHGAVDDDSSVYEEKMKLYWAGDLLDAYHASAIDSERYLALNEGFQRVGQVVVFLVEGGSAAMDGCEVWSLLCQGHKDAKEFYEERYERFDLK